MTRRLARQLAPVLFLFGFQVAEAEKVWLEQDGLVVIEAESVENLGGKQWSANTEKPGYSGSGALITTGSYNNGQGTVAYSSSMVSSSKTIAYRIKITNPGFYAVKLRNWHSSQDGGNDVWVSLNKREFKKFWDHDVKSYTWDEGHTRFYGEWLVADSIPADSIVDLMFSCRSAWFRLDRIALFTTGVSSRVWSDTAQPENPTVVQYTRNGSIPGVADGIRAENLTPVSAQFRWNPVTPKPWRYVLYLDGKPIGATAATSFLFERLQPRSAATLTIRSRSLTGTLSPPSPPHSFSTPAFTAGVNRALLPRVQSGPSVDGTADALWQSIPSSSVQNVVLGSTVSKADLSATFRMCWTQQNLFALVEVTDDVVRSASPPGSKWDAARRDGVDIHIDLDRTRLCHNGPRDFNYRLGYGDTNPYEVANWFEPDRHTTGVKVAWKKNAGGYTGEVSIPWATVGGRPTAGALVGLDVLINDDDTDAREGGESREARIAWCDTVRDYVSCWNFWPERMGQALLIDGDASAMRAAAYPQRQSPAAPAPPISLQGQTMGIRCQAIGALQLYRSSRRLGVNLP